MHPAALFAIRLITETTAGMVVSRMLKPVVQSASGLTKAALWIGTASISTAVGAYTGSIINDTINESIRIGKEAVEIED